MRRCVIIGSAEIKDYEKIKSHLKNDDFFVFCDGGLTHAENLGVSPDFIVGDFDSYTGSRDFDVPTVTLPRAKDDTDTVFAVKKMMNDGFDDFLLIGVTGQRLDHTMCNLSLLLMIDSAGKTGIIVDDYSEITVLKNHPVEIFADECSYFSLLCIEGTIRGVNILSAKFPLNCATIEPDYQYAVSNEVLDKKSTVLVENGRALLMKIQ